MILTFDGDSTPNYYTNSARQVVLQMRANNIPLALNFRQTYEKTYGVILHYNEGFICGVEFLNENDATMFILQWS